MSFWSIVPGLIRILTALLIIGLAWLRHESWFLVALVILIILFACEEVLKWRQQSDARIQNFDAVADTLTFVAIPAGGWLLFPHLIIQERGFVAIVVVTYCATALYGYATAKQHQQSRTKTAGVLPILLAVSVLFAFITNNTWAFRVLAAVSILTVPRFLLSKKNRQAVQK